MRNDAAAICATGRYLCEQCGTRFDWSSTTNRPPKYCSRECFKAKERERVAKYPRAPYQPMHGPRGCVCVCVFCGAEFVAANRRTKMCGSDDCRKARGREQASTSVAKRIVDGRSCTSTDCKRTEYAVGLCRRHYKSLTTGTTLTDRFICAMCGRDCIPGSDGVSSFASRFCSTPCKKTYLSDLRRAGDAYVDAVFREEIFRRDRWTCQLCGKKIPRNVTWPHPLFATIDHMTPLSRGGAHEPANCQAAHFRCNAAKGARGGGEQLALIG